MIYIPEPELIQILDKIEQHGVQITVNGYPYHVYDAALVSDEIPELLESNWPGYVGYRYFTDAGANAEYKDDTLTLYASESVTCTGLTIEIPKNKIYEQIHNIKA